MTLIALVDATLQGVGLLGPGALYVIDAVRVFTCQPVVRAIRRTENTPAVDLQRTALSDTHAVPSFPLSPNRDGLL